MNHTNFVSSPCEGAGGLFIILFFHFQSGVINENTLQEYLDLNATIVSGSANALLFNTKKKELKELEKKRDDAKKKLEVLQQAVLVLLPSTFPSFCMRLRTRTFGNLHVELQFIFIGHISSIVDRMRLSCEFLPVNVECFAVE